MRSVPGVCPPGSGFGEGCADVRRPESPSLRPRSHRQAYLHAYALLERVQGEDAAEAVEELVTAGRQAEHAGWADVRFVLEVADVVYRLPRVAPDVGAKLTSDLLRRAETTQAPAYRAIALALGALSSGGDTAQLIASTARAVALLDDDELPGMSRCLGYVITAAAFNSLNLFELVDELYQRALRLGAACEDSLQTNAIAVNRVLVGTEWALALVENGDPSAGSRLAGVLEAASVALLRPLSPLWLADVLACRDTVGLLSTTSDEELVRALSTVRTSMAGYRQLLEDGGDVETRPSLDAALALAELRVGDPERARAVASGLHSPQSLSSGARTFPLWVRAQVEAAGLPPEVAAAQQDYARLVSRLRWQSRGAVLAAARAQIASERRRSEHDRLRQAVETDVLTGLRNRRVFDRALRECVGPVALLLIDVDGFKPINDTFGHHVGDEVLRRIGALMRQTCRPGDLAIRQGGDEFALILQGEAVVSSAAVELARRFSTAVLGERWPEVAENLAVSVSIGLAYGRVEPDRVDTDGVLVDARMLYLSADAALYESKRTGGPVTAATPARLAS